MRRVEQARLIETFQSLRTLSRSSRLRPGLRAFLRAHPEAWPYPKIGLRLSASTCHSLPQADAAASSLRASGRHTSSASCRTSPHGPLATATAAHRELFFPIEAGT